MYGSSACGENEIICSIETIGSSLACFTDYIVGRIMGELHMTQLSHRHRESSPDIFDECSTSLSPNIFSSSGNLSSDIFDEETGSAKSSDLFSSMDMQYVTATQQSIEIFSVDKSKNNEESESIDLFDSISSQSTKMEVENLATNSPLNLEENPKTFTMKLFLESHCGDAVTIHSSEDKADDAVTMCGSPVE